MKQVFSFLIFILVSILLFKVAIRIIPIFLILAAVYFTFKWIQSKFSKPIAQAEGYAKHSQVEREVEVRVIDEPIDLQERIKKAKESSAL